MSDATVLEDDDEPLHELDCRIESLIEDVGTEGVIQQLRAYMHNEYPDDDVTKIDQSLSLLPGVYGAITDPFDG